MTKLSVITATYNAEEFLPRLIESLQDQTDTDFQWVVADGGSTDRTLDILRSVKGLNLKLNSTRDFGIYDGLNRAIEAADCDYYVTAGADDAFSPNAIADYKAVADRTGAPFITFDIISDGRRCSPKGGSIALNRQMKFISGHSLGTLIKKEMHREYGLYSRKFPIAADQYFLEKAYRAGEKFHHEPIVAGQFGDAGVSKVDKLGTYTESFRIHVELFGKLGLHLAILALTLLKNYRKPNR